MGSLNEDDISYIWFMVFMFLDTPEISFGFKADFIRYINELIQGYHALSE